MTSAGAGGFAKGFASGFVTTFTAAQQRKHETDQLTLKSRLDQLREDAEARKKKQEEEQGYLKDGETLAQMLGDPSLAPEIANLRRTVSAEQILAGMRDGYIKPKPASVSKTVETKNPDLVANDKVPAVSQMVMPAGVIPVDKNALQPIPNYDPSRTPLDGVELSQPLPYDENAEIAKARGMDPADLKASTERADQTIRDAGIRLDDPEETNKKIERTIAQNSSSRLKFVPDRVEEKLESLASEVYKMDKAKADGDILLYQEQQRKVEAIKMAEVIKANAEAEAKGEDVKNYAIVDQNGRLVSFVPAKEGPNGEPINYSRDNNGRQNPIVPAPGQRFVRVTMDQIKQSWQVKEQFAKQSKDYTVATVATAETVSIFRKMDDLLARNPSITTKTQTLASYAQQGLEEVKAVQRFFDQARDDAKENFKEGGDPYVVSSRIAEMTQKLGELESSRLSLSDKNAQDVLDKTIFENYKILAAYKLALANGQAGQAAGEKDLQRHLAMVGDGSKPAASVRKVLANQLKEQINKNENMADELDRELAEWEPLLGFKPNVKPQRVGNMLKDKADRQYYDQVRTSADLSRNEAIMKKQEADAAVTAPVEQAPAKVQVMTKEEYDALPSGTEYIDPKGNPRRKK